MVGDVYEVRIVPTSFAFGRPAVVFFTVSSSVAVLALRIVPFFSAVVDVALSIVIDDEVVLV
tara:strand:- start:29704 stop:29889 length:186 start_codon:yes stop_codon:yes gene_type:complete